MFIPQKLPLRDGVSPSCVATPSVASNKWLTMFDFLQERLPFVSPNVWVQRILANEVMDEFGNFVTLKSIFRCNTRLFYYRYVENEDELPFSENILFQDEHLLVVDKPHFMAVVPSGSYLQQTLLVRLKRRLNLPDLTPIHRLDRETAGLVLFSVQAQTRNLYQTLFRDHQIKKRYEAVAPWKPELSFPLKRQSRIVEGKPFFRSCEVQGEINSETVIDVLQILKKQETTMEKNQYALYELKPVTGKKHQLRVHMNALGLPILNDAFYPEVNHRKPNDYSEPLQLLARSLDFVDPVYDQNRHFESQFNLIGVD